MNKKYYDLYIKVKNYDVNLCDEIVSYVGKLRFKGFSIPLVIDEKHQKISKKYWIFLERCKECSDEKGIDFVSRLDIRYKSISHIKKFLRKFRKRFEIISVLGINREVISFASRDHRVDIITFYPFKTFRLLKGDIEYIKKQNKIIEFLLEFLRKCENIEKLAYRLMLYRYNIELLSRKKISHIFSSGLYFEERSYSIQYIFDLYNLLGGRKDSLVKSMIEDLNNILEKNRKKLLGKIILPGVEILDED